ncbi:hypothetical protein LguiA_004764 [Lonicera macranthoides]
MFTDSNNTVGLKNLELAAVAAMAHFQSSALRTSTRVIFFDPDSLTIVLSLAIFELGNTNLLVTQCFFISERSGTVMASFVEGWKMK